MHAIVLLSDFGSADAYVGVMKGVLHGLAPGAPLIDLTHGVPPGNIRLAQLHLDAAWPYFPTGTIFLCVVDPGVGSSRRAVGVASRGRCFVGPDNGLLSALPDARWRVIDTASNPPRSNTFHGRDVFAPAAGRLATGAPFDELGSEIDDPVRLTLPVPDGDRGEILAIDHFGNAISNLPGRGVGRLSVAGRTVPVLRTYADVEPGEPLALTGSTGRLEVAVRNGNAAVAHGIVVGAPVEYLP